MNAPIDATHAASIGAVRVIRQQIAALRADAARWAPSPPPLPDRTGDTQRAGSRRTTGRWFR